jgi:hypothetical protein
MLRNELNTVLAKSGGSVQDLIVVPDFQGLFELESEKKDLEDLHHLIMTHGDPSMGVRCCLGVVWTHGNFRRSAVEERIHAIELEIDKQLERPFTSSGHAFVLLDSPQSLAYCLSKPS